MAKWESCGDDACSCCRIAGRAIADLQDDVRDMRDERDAAKSEMSLGMRQTYCARCFKPFPYRGLEPKWCSKACELGMPEPQVVATVSRAGR